MKISFTLIALLLCMIACAQTDSIVHDTQIAPFNIQQQNIYNPQTKTNNTSYNYSGLWDLDGDKNTDTVFFIGNGGVHTYFHLSVILSKNNITQNFPFINLDMPYPANRKLLNQSGKNAGLQFAVADFDSDGIMDMYLNFNNPFGSLPVEWLRKGINSRYVLISFAGGKIKVRNYY